MRSKRQALLRGLYALTPAWPDTARLVAGVEACIRGGARIVQYRAKDVDPEAALAQARRLAAACARHGVALIVNDSVPLAIACGAAGVHLGRDDATPEEARRAMPQGIVGVSCYDEPERARAAARAGADYVAVGSMYPSPTKPGAVRAGLPLIAAAREAAGGLPVAAIGGITAANVASVVAAGADMAAVISAIFEAEDIERAARELARPFDEPFRGAHDARAQPRTV